MMPLTVPSHVQRPDAHTDHSGLTCGPEAACLELLGTWKQLMEAFGLRLGTGPPEGTCRAQQLRELRRGSAWSGGQRGPEANFLGAFGEGSALARAVAGSFRGCFGPGARTCLGQGGQC